MKNILNKIQNDHSLKGIDEKHNLVFYGQHKRGVGDERGVGPQRGGHLGDGHAPRVQQPVLGHQPRAVAHQVLLQNKEPQHCVQVVLHVLYGVVEVTRRDQD
jgi:hypothetical protein